MLPDNFVEPDNFQWGTFKNKEGATIRYGSIQPEGTPKGTMVFATGFREPIEKYFETIRDMTARGFAVWILDWHGQGGSDRYMKQTPQRMHSIGYDEHIDTLHQFATKVVKKNAGPTILAGHSMGGHISLRFLKEHPGVFDSAILTAPMVDVVTAMPNKLARLIVSFARFGGTQERYAPGHKDWFDGRDPFEGNLKTSDRARYDVLDEIFRTKPTLTMGDATYGWVYHTFQSISVLNREDYLKEIKTPILMQVSGDDGIVNKNAALRAAKIIPNCTTYEMPTSKHEIWMERDELRNQWLTRLDAFLAPQLKPAAPAPKKPSPKGPKPG